MVFVRIGVPATGVDVCCLFGVCVADEQLLSQRTRADTFISEAARPSSVPLLLMAPGLQQRSSSALTSRVDMLNLSAVRFSVAALQCTDDADEEAEEF